VSILIKAHSSLGTATDDGRAEADLAWVRVKEILSTKLGPEEVLQVSLGIQPLLVGRRDVPLGVHLQDVIDG
jgi:hypothetical protein